MMEEAWERRRVPVELTPEELARLVHSYAPDAPLLSVVPLSNGKANANYLLRLGDRTEPLVLRIALRDPAMMAVEVEITRRIQGSVPVPEVLFVGQEAVSGWTYALLSYIEGDDLTALVAAGEGASVLSAAFDLGRTLAKIQSYRFPEAGFFGMMANRLVIAHPLGEVIAGYGAHIEHCLYRGRAGARLGDTLARSVWAHWSANREMLTANAGAVCLTHGDYKASNLRIRAGSVAGILDWEFCHAGTFLTDVGNLLRHHHDLPPEFPARFAAGFREEGGVLPEGWERFARLVDMVSLCDFLNLPDDRPRLFADVTTLLQRTLIHDAS